MNFVKKVWLVIAVAVVVVDEKEVNHQFKSKYEPQIQTY